MYSKVVESDGTVDVDDSYLVSHECVYHMSVYHMCVCVSVSCSLDSTSTT